MKYSLLMLSLLLMGCSETSTSLFQSPTYEYESDRAEVIKDYDDGYEWAEENDTDNFEECEYEFGVGEAEDGCNKYVQENHYDGPTTFNGYDCSENCSGHEAGYQWAEENGIDDSSDCDGNSDSFNEGCESYVEENGYDNNYQNDEDNEYDY